MKKIALYHGTDVPPSGFNIDSDYDGDGGNTWSGELPYGYLFLTTDKREASSYGRYVIPCELEDYSSISFVVDTDNPSRAFDMDYGIDLFKPAEYHDYWGKFLNSGKRVLVIEGYDKKTVITDWENVIPRIDLAESCNNVDVNERRKRKKRKGKLGNRLVTRAANYAIKKALKKKKKRKAKKLRKNKNRKVGINADNNTDKVKKLPRFSKIINEQSRTVNEATATEINNYEHEGYFWDVTNCYQMAQRMVDYVENNAFTQKLGKFCDDYNMTIGSQTKKTLSTDHNMDYVELRLEYDIRSNAGGLSGDVVAPNAHMYFKKKYQPRVEISSGQLVVTLFLD